MKFNKEDKNHLFLHCNFAKSVFKLTLDITTGGVTHDLDSLKWLSQLPHIDDNDLSLCSKAILICWQIWNDRNNLIFRNGKVHPAKVPIFAGSYWKRLPTSKY